MNKPNQTNQADAQSEKHSQPGLQNLSGDAFVQNPEQNNQIHKAALGPNTKR